MNVDPEPLGKLPAGDLGAVTLDSADMALKYGVLGVRFNTLREFYGCVREAVNTQKEVEGCL